MTTPSSSWEVSTDSPSFTSNATSRSRAGWASVIDLSLLVERIGRSSLGIAIVCHRDGIERLRARMVTAMMSIETGKPVALPQKLRDAIESYRRRTTNG